MQPVRNERMGLRSATWVAGVLLGFVGAIIDFYSTYLILNQSQTVNEMGMAAGYTSAGLAWGIGIAVLGVVLVVTSAALLFPLRMNRMGDFGILMVVYGLAMLFIGSSMYLGVASMMSGALIPAVYMLAVGALMIANGALMLSARSA